MSIKVALQNIYNWQITLFISNDTVLLIKL